VGRKGARNVRVEKSRNAFPLPPLLHSSRNRISGSSDRMRSAGIQVVASPTDDWPEPLRQAPEDSSEHAAGQKSQNQSCCRTESEQLDLPAQCGAENFLAWRRGRSLRLTRASAGSRNKQQRVIYTSADFKSHSMSEVSRTLNRARSPPCRSRGARETARRCRFAGVAPRLSPHGAACQSK
jgi:hypothetical protein